MIVTEPALQIEYAAPAGLQRQPDGWWREVLALVRFDHGADGPPWSDPDRGIPSPEVKTPVLGSSDHRAEIWRVAAPMQSGTHGRVHYRGNERLLFAALCVAEAQFGAAGAAPAAALRAATAAAYHELFATLEQLGCPHPLRMWTYLPQINEAAGGAERYWHFNDARQDAFVGARRATSGNVPAASVLGTAPGGSLVLYCIAAAQAPITLENPRQCSAWRYPPQYGPRSPIFARACIDADGTLFISGTASIVGHESTHAGDVAAQTRETVSNIRALVHTANECDQNGRGGGACYAAERLRYKVYVRRPEDQPLIEQTLRREIGPAPPVLFLRADICRRELLVEIEAVGA